MNVDTLLALDVDCLRPRSGGALHRSLCSRRSPSVQCGTTPFLAAKAAIPAEALAQSREIILKRYSQL